VQPSSRPTRLILALGGLSVIAALAFALRVSHQMPDFEVYWRSAQRAWAGEPLYRTEDGFWLFKYLPAFAVLIAPLALVPLSSAKAIWFALTVVALVALLRICVLLLPERRRSPFLLVTATVVVMGKFYGHELLLGQSNLLLTLAAAAGLLALKHQRDTLGGVLFVVAIVLKPYAVLFLPWLLARRRRDSIVAAAAGVTTMFLLPVIRYGATTTMRLHLDWWRTVVSSIEPNLLSPDNVSWIAMYSRWLGTGSPARALAVLTAVTAIGSIAYVYSMRRSVTFPELLEGAMLLTLMPFLSPQGWDYTVLMATPAVVCLVNYEDRLAHPLRLSIVAALAAIGLSIYDVMGPTLYTAFMRNSGITVACFVVLAGLVSLRRRAIA
jgi:hypothetical protein